MAILEFLRRLTDLTWERAHQTTLVAIRWMLLVTFGAVVISDLAECQPFYEYWQVLPDPGGACRQGYAQLITMATCNVITDLMLVLFPSVIILRSHMRLKRKVQLAMLFSLSLAVVGVTLYRVPHIIQMHGRQQYRSLLASVELLFATGAANALVLGSFVRDRGVKKQKFRRTSTADSFDRSSNPRRPTMHHHWGSDEDLVRDVGLAVEPELRKKSSERGRTEVFTPAPIVQQTVDEEDEWKAEEAPNSAHNSDEPLSGFYRLSQGETKQEGPRKLSFFDVGGLLKESPSNSSASYRRGSHTSSTIDPLATGPIPTPAVQASTGGRRRGSSALLQDIGGLFGPLNGRTSWARPKNDTELNNMAPRDRPPSGQGAHLDIHDPGGLLK